MGLRKYEREIARSRLKALGVGNVNKKMNGKVRMSHGKVRKMMKYKLGRKQLNSLIKAGVANWRRVTWGDLAHDGYLAQCHPEELKRKLNRRKMIRKKVKA